MIIKALSDANVYKNSIPIIYGSSKSISFHKKAAQKDEFNYLAVKNAAEAKPKKINVINCWSIISYLWDKYNIFMVISSSPN